MSTPTQKDAPTRTRMSPGARTLKSGPRTRATQRMPPPARVHMTQHGHTHTHLQQAVGQRRRVSQHHAHCGRAHKQEHSAACTCTPHCKHLQRAVGQRRRVAQHHAHCGRAHKQEHPAAYARTPHCTYLQRAVGQRGRAAQYHTHSRPISMAAQLAASGFQ